MIAIAARSGDAAGYVVRLDLQLRALAREIEVRREARRDAEVLLVLIGPAWAEPPLDQPSVDAIAATLAADRQVIPILVQGARMPEEKMKLTVDS